MPDARRYQHRSFTLTCRIDALLADAKARVAARQGFVGSKQSLRKRAVFAVLVIR